MPFLRADSGLNDTPTTHLLMRSPFLIFRLVLLALLSNLAFLSLIFASWNVNATLSVGLSAPSTSIMIIFESCVVFFCVALAVADFFRPKWNTSRTTLECGWVGTLSMFQIAAAISSTISGPAMACHLTSDWGVCASSSLLVPLTWLSSVLSLAYFLTLFITVMAHRDLYPDIWKRTMYEIEWFGQAQHSSSKEKVVQDFLRQKPLPEDNPYFDLYEDIESTSARKKHFPIRGSIGNAAPWAVAPVRRGIDAPFARSHGLASNCSSPTLLPSIPDRSAGSGTVGSRFVEKFRESSLLARSESPAQYHYHAHTNSFPPSVADLDQPIPLPRLSEWVRADALRGINVHSNPHTTGPP